MIIYTDGQVSKTFPNFILKKDNGYGLHLIGINAIQIQRRLDLAPVYLPMFTFEPFAGGVLVQVPTRGRIHFFVFKGTPPFVSHESTVFTAQETEL